MLKEIEVEIELIEPMLGTVPKDPVIYKTFIESKKPEDILDEESKTVEKIEQKGWTGFHKDEQGLFIFDYMIRGFLKNAGNVLKDSLGVKNIKSKIDNQLFVFPRKIYFGKSKPDGIIERPLRAMTMQGPRVTLARSDFVAAGSRLRFVLKWFNGKDINEKIIRECLAYGELQGLGQFRNGSYGRFKVLESVK